MTLLTLVENAVRYAVSTRAEGATIGIVARRDGDVLVRVGEQPVNTFEELRQTVGVLAPGTTVHLQVLRRGKLIDVPLTLDVKPIAAEAGTDVPAGQS